MKKKLIQLLMLLVVAVSVGSFVSCKDTNEDLYNELRTKYIQDNATLKEAFDAQVAELEDQIATYKEALDALEEAFSGFKSCGCDEDALKALINGLTEQIEGINDQIATLTAGLEKAATQEQVNAINATIAALKQQVDDMDGALKALIAAFNPLASEFASYKTAQDILTNTVNDLSAALEQVKNDLAGVNQCKCDYNYVTNKLVELETKMSAAEAQAKQAYDLATSAVTKADEAKDIANGASSAANEAKLTAQQAKDAADAATTAATNATDAAQQAVTAAALAQQAAEAAGLTAGEAKQFAQQAQENANTALQTANAANALATSANTLAQSALDKANENATNIATLQENARIVENLVNKNTEDIAKNALDITDLQGKVQKNIEDIAKNASDIATNAQNIQTNAQNIQTNANEISAIKTQLTTMSEATQAALDRANEAYAKAEANYSLISGINETIAGMKGTYDEKFRNLENTTSTLTQNLQHLTEVVGGNTTKIEGLQTSVSSLTSTVDRLTTKIDSLGTVVSNLQSELAEVKTKCEGLLGEAQLLVTAEIATAKAEILDYVFKNYVTKEQLESYATKEQLKDSVAAIMEKVLTEFMSDRQRIRANEVDIEWLKKMWTPDIYREIFERITALEGATETIKNEIIQIINETITEKITEVIKEQIISGGEITEEITNIINNILEDGDYITEDDVMPIVDGVIAGVGDEEIKNMVELVTIVSTLNGTVSELSDQVDANTTNIGTLQDQVSDLEDAIDGINTRLDGVESRLDDVESRLDDVEDAIDQLNEDIAAIQNALAKQVTGIIVQGTFNPMFGSFSIPANFQTNALIAFYGVPFKDVEFPTDDDQNYVRKEEVLTAKDMEMLGDVEIFEAPANLPILNEEGNAGKVYMTINPNTADLEGLKLSLVNTLDEESPIKLSPIRKCNEKLQFGYTRADNGFYVADAFVTPQTVMEEDNGLALTRDDITALYHEVHAQMVNIGDNFFTPGRQSDLGKLATSVYQVISSLKADRNGLKCTTTTDDGKERSVYSEYNLAATFYKPLNLAWGKDFNYVTMPGYEAFEEILNGIAATLKENLDVSTATGVIQQIANELKIEELKFIGLTEDFIAKFEARVSSITLNGVGYVIKAPGTGNFEVKFDKNLTAGGSPVAVPEAVAFDDENITEKRATLIVFGDIVDGLKLKILVPARGGDDKVEAYASLVFDDSYATAQLIDGMITLNVGTETYALAAYTGSNLAITSDCVDFVILKDCVGRDGSINLPVVLEFTDDVRALLSEQEGILDKIVQELNDNLDRINNYSGNAWIDSFMEEYLWKYLNQINNDYCFFFNSINRRFGPFLVASNSGKGFKRLSFSKEYPTKMAKQDLQLHPTTKNLELIVPLARKHVAITNVFKGSASAQGGDADCKAKLQAANTGQLNTVVDGTVRKIDVTGMVPGYVYEVAYSILDFDGNISTIKSYITVE